MQLYDEFSYTSGWGEYAAAAVHAARSRRHKRTCCKPSPDIPHLAKTASAIAAILVDMVAG